MSIDQYLNRLLVSPEGFYWTVLKDRSRRKQQYSIVRADQVSTSTGTGYYLRTVRHDMPCFSAEDGSFAQVNESQDGAAILFERWKLKPVEIFNGYPEAFEALLIEAARRQLPQNYREDLTVHDKAELTSPGWCSKDFLWCLRTSGTAIVKLDRNKLQTSRGNRAADCFNALNHFGDSELYWYVYRDGKLREISAEKAREIAIEADEQALRRAS